MCVCVCVYSECITMCWDSCVHLHKLYSVWKPASRLLSASVYLCTLLMFLCVLERQTERERVVGRERGVREKSPSQCMTLCNRLGIKLMTTKTFSALKPIYTPIQASLMLALKSTTNSPWRKSLAHGGCSGRLRLCVCVCACERRFICENVRECVRAQHPCLSTRWRTAFQLLSSLALESFFFFISICSNIWSVVFLCFVLISDHTSKLSQDIPSSNVFINFSSVQV